MADENGMEAFLHIVHVSDMHCSDGSTPTDLRAERFIQSVVRQLRRLSEEKAEYVETLWEEGLAGHDPEAHDAFCDFLTWFMAQSAFQGPEIWLLDTGDRSSMGDFGAIDTAGAWLDDYRTILGAVQFISLYGNHDAWPEKFPFGVSSAEVEAHGVELRKARFPSRWPIPPVGVAIPGTPSKVVLNAVNSAIDDNWDNVVALGRVGVDPPWSSAGGGTDQLVQLAYAAERQFHPDGKTRDFRILAVHHPVHYPPPRPQATMSMLNDRQVADALIKFDQKKRGKLAHLLLSGHTHETYPPLGNLPRNVAGKAYVPLASGQLQLIAGSLSQEGARHECQILTFFASPRSAHRMLLIERRIVGRIGGAGPYGFLTPPTSGQTVEAVRIEY